MWWVIPRALKLPSHEELQQARDAAETANKAKSMFITTMSHELRTPLNAVLGFSELMRQDESLTVKQQETLDIINRSGTHLLGMINDILDISKIEAGRFELDSQNFDLLKLFTDVGDMIAMRAATKQLSFSLDIAADMVQYIHADSGKIRQVLINLLGNAIKFTQQGSIILRAQTQPLSNERVMLTVEVIDTGMGIPEDKLGDLFKPFVQLAQGNVDVKGTGLGLAISKSLIELMGGHLSFSSEFGVGSTFKVEVPVLLATEDLLDIEKHSQSIKALAPDQPDYRLLIVDDVFDNRLLLASLLREVGFQVYEASNGLEAIAQFEKWQPALCWMDMRMPVMDGYQATAKIRQLPGGDAVKIIALTASAFKEQHSSIIEAGCDAVLHKPFHAAEIFATLTKYLGVKFIYREKTGQISTTAVEVTAPMLSELPLELRQQLHHAALNLDIEETVAILAQVAELNPSLATGLHELTAHFQFEQIALLSCPPTRKEG